MTGTDSPPLAGRYVLIDQIGAGGMGSVWRAWDLRTRAFVAAKVLGQHDGGMLLRFVREQSVRIQHPHVVAPSGWAAEDNLVIFTMDLVRGGSVQTLLGDHGPLPESYVAVLLDQTLQALEAVHGAGVVHRDVKPANLLLEATGTRRPHVRLSDFGVAALIDEVRLTRFPGAIGTDGYMAPEQALGAHPDPRQDLYAVGVVAIQLLTGLAPRQQSGVPDCRLRPLLEALIDPDPERRPATATAALGQLRQLGVPPGAPWQSDPEPPEVFDQLGEVDIPEGPSYGGGSGAGPSLVKSPARAATPARPARPAASGSSGAGRGGSSGAGPASGSSGASPSPWAPPPVGGPAQGPPSQGGSRPVPGSPLGHGTGPAARTGHQPEAPTSNAALIVAIACFVASIGLCVLALYLMFD